MNIHGLKLAFRYLYKNKSFTLINLAGLSTALSACIIILVYYTYELSFDRHIPDNERTYRVITGLQDGNLWSRTFACFGDALSNRPEVESSTTFINTSNSRIVIAEDSYIVQESVIADTSFIDFFDIKIISGRKQDLGKPNNVFITPDLAEKIFPGADPLGRDLFLSQFEGNTADSIGYFTIAGVVEPLPDNTHFGFQLIFSQQGNLSGLLNHLKQGKFFAANVYVRLYANTLASELEEDMTGLLLPFLQASPGPPVEAFKSKLQAVREIHFTTDINREPRSVTPRSMILLMMSVGFLILVLLTLNFISTAIVQSNKQKKIIGIMRIHGSNRLRLFQVSVIQVALFVGISLLLSWLIIYFLQSFLESIFGPGWSFSSLSLNILFTGILVGLPVVFLAALAMYSSGLNNSPVELLKAKSPSSRNPFHIFGVLTILQFGIVILLLGFSIMISRQIRFLDRTDLGYQHENILVVRIPSQQPRGNILVEEIEQQKAVISASTAHHHPADIFQHMEFSARDKIYPFEFRMVDPGIFETLDITLLKTFGSSSDDMNGWVINETFYNQLLKDYSQDDIAASNFNVENDDPDDPGTRFIISGVMKDFHYGSLHKQIGNFAFVMRHPENLYNRWLIIRYEQGQSEFVLSAIDRMMDTHFPGRDYDSFYLEDSLASSYKNSRDLSRIIIIFTILSILIASFGLYGLSLFITRKRVREIGIRKVHGATAWQVIYMLNLGFLKWVGIAFVIACPLTLWVLKKWLMNFAYQATPAWWIFVVAGIAIAAIAMIAVTWQTFSAARRNPVDAIRHE